MKVRTLLIGAVMLMASTANAAIFDGEWRTFNYGRNAVVSYDNQAYVCVAPLQCNRTDVPGIAKDWLLIVDAPFSFQF